MHVLTRLRPDRDPEVGTLSRSAHGCPGKVEGVNLLVAGACPARRRFSVYFLVCETQKEDGACASHLASSVSCWNRSSGVSSRHWWRGTLAMPMSNRFQQLTEDARCEAH